jgi:hypothetical protein
MKAHKNPESWLVLLFSLPAKKAATRVEVWRRLKKYGAVALDGGGYVLPSSDDRREQFEWIAGNVRRAGGSASVLQVTSVGHLSNDELRGIFLKAREADYRELMKQYNALGSTGVEVVRGRLSKRLLEVIAIDFFESPLQATARGLFAERSTQMEKPGKAVHGKFTSRVWVTRPRPKIDRVASAWLIKKFIDKHATFAFADDPSAVPNAVAFDMYQAEGFGHRGDDCTFETLLKEFRLKDKALQTIGEIVHDADLGDEKFGRAEGIGILAVLKGWLADGVSDQDMLKRGGELMEALWKSHSAPTEKKKVRSGVR